MKNSYPQSNDYSPGTWKGLKTSGGRKASFSCPLCGGLGTLSGHEIDPMGGVSPSVVCHNDRCSFHEHITLEGWETLTPIDPD